MGSCSSVHRSKRQTVASVAEPRKKEEPLNVNWEEMSAVKVVGSSFSLKSSQFGSKDETFFDSRAWLDSDCDDDFFSVNGDFTPSRGTTPNNQTSILLRTKSDKTLAFDKLPNAKSEPSPTGRKKLSDLFQETAEPNASDEKLETNEEQDSSNQTKSEQPLDRANSKTNSELSTPSRELKNKKKAGEKTAQCCFPSLSLGQSFSCSERSQKMSPVHCSA